MDDKEKERSDGKLKAWLAELLKDLIVATIAAIVSKLIE